MKHMMADKLDLTFLKELEREKVLDVLYRDKVLRTVEEERIRKLRSELQEIRRKGAKSFTRQYSGRTCARCQRPLGKLLNSGAVCKGCSHRICTKCRIVLSPRMWKCTACYALGQVKVKSGDWFLEERSKKFPQEGDAESIGEKLLKSCPRISKISIVPPTPPPFLDESAGSSMGDLAYPKGFTKSMENLFVSLTTNIRKMSKSQDDMRADRTRLTADYQSPRKERRSKSDTAINSAATLSKAPSLPNLSKGERGENVGKDNRLEASFKPASKARSATTLFSGRENRGSICSLSSSEAGCFEDSAITGEIEFSLSYNFKSSCLEIDIKACKNLVNLGEKKRKCNPYIKTYLLPDKSPQSKLKTTIKKNTVDPVFNETLRYNISHSQLETRMLQVSVWHSGTLKRKVFLGSVEIPLESWKFEDNSTQTFKWYQLNAKDSRSENWLPLQYNGELLVKAMFELPTNNGRRQWDMYANDDIDEKMDDVGQLSVFIIGAKNLPSTRADGTLNSFVKGSLVTPDMQERKLKTQVLKRVTDPQWKHQFVYKGISLGELHESNLDLTVWDQATLGLSDRFLGGVRLEKGTLLRGPINQTEAAHREAWEAILKRPNEWNTVNLTLQSNPALVRA
ncbi:synaptotagmin-like protein 3 [Erpetoichthys calabaricus]|nr:synaptotagmin-like protein 3 [Erpetoichthys calabaricus]